MQILREVSGLVAAGVLVEDEELGQGYYRFPDPAATHTIVAESETDEVSAMAHALVDHLLKGEREGVERHLAIAHVSSIAGLKPERGDWIVEAARHSLEAGLKKPAVSYYHLALSSLSDRELSAERDCRAYVECVLGLIKLQGHLMPLAEQKELLSQALNYAERLNSPAVTARLKLYYAKLSRAEGEYSHAASLFDEAWRLAEQTANEELLQQAALSTAEFLFWQGRVRDAVQRYETVVGSLEVLSSDDATLKGCAILGWCYSICGNTARGIGLIRAIHDKSEKLSLQFILPNRSLDSMVLAIFPSNLLKACSWSRTGTIPSTLFFSPSILLMRVEPPFLKLRYPIWLSHLFR